MTDKSLDIMDDYISRSLVNIIIKEPVCRMKISRSGMDNAKDLQASVHIWNACTVR